MWFKSNTEADWENSPVTITPYNEVMTSQAANRFCKMKKMKFELEKHFDEILKNNV